jgi:hypothetical protein
MFNRILFASLALLIATAACGLQVNLPPRATAGPTVTDKIQVPAPPDGDAHLILNFGAGELGLAPGSGPELVSGTARYNVAELKPTISNEDGTIKIAQGDLTFNNLPGVDDMINTWELALGDSPMDLTIEAGAYKADFELGGLALGGLTVRDGASEVNLVFSQPNRTEMTVLRYETGASNVTLKGLANANAATIIFKAGAGNYTLDFSGTLQRSASISIDSGMSNVTLVIPRGVAAQLTVDAGLTNVNLPSGWEQRGNIYTQEGSGPLLTFIINMGAGNLQVTH